MGSLRWLYIDFNSYFASVEQQLDPFLRHKPIAVIPVQSDSTCAIAASYEAKAFGIKTGTPIYEAKKMCKDLICVLAQHEAYLDFHHRILKEVDRHIPVSKVCSIDEVACELMDNESSETQAGRIAEKVKRGIAENVGAFIRCSIGIAPNRYLAKVATDMKKPDGLTFIHQEDLPQKLYSLSLRDLPGVGQNLQTRLHRFGIYTMEALCKLDLKQMRRAWGSVWGERMWHYLQGIDLPDLETKRGSVSHSHVLPPQLRETIEARQVARRLVLKAASRLRRMEYVASAISLGVRGEDGVRYEANRECLQTSDSFTFLHLLEVMWEEIFAQIKLSRVKKISIALHQLKETAALQPELFQLAEETRKVSREKSEKLSRVLDTINHRYGKDSVSIGMIPGQGKTFPGTKIAFTRIPDKQEFIE